MPWSIHRKIIVIYLLALLLTSCSGGGGSDAILQSDPVDNAPADTTPLTISTGAITGFGSVFVNDMVEVSGFIDADNNILASRVGTVDNLQETASSGHLLVDGIEIVLADEISIDSFE